MDRFLLVSEEICPQAFIKVIKAKKLMSLYKEKSLNEILKEADISRSTFYKYKDKVFTYDKMPRSKVVSLYFVVEDFSGILANIIGKIARIKGNILTINQNVPLNGLADVIISIDTESMTSSLEELINDISSIEGVSRSEILNKDIV